MRIERILPSWTWKMPTKGKSERPTPQGDLQMIWRSPTFRLKGCPANGTSPRCGCVARHRRRDPLRLHDFRGVRASGTTSDAHAPAPKVSGTFTTGRSGAGRVAGRVIPPRRAAHTSRASKLPLPGIGRTDGRGHRPTESDERASPTPIRPRRTAPRIAVRVRRSRVPGDDHAGGRRVRRGAAGADPSSRTHGAEPWGSRVNSPFDRPH